MFDYLQITAGSLTTLQTIPGLVAVVNVANPSGGGLVGRNKYFDDGSPLPRDRVFIDYSHVGDFKALGTAFDVNRYVFGMEKTFLNGFGSVEVLVPFAGTANSAQTGGQPLDLNNVEFGNVDGQPGLEIRWAAWPRDPSMGSLASSLASDLQQRDDNFAVIGVGHNRRRTIQGVNHATCPLSLPTGEILPGKRKHCPPDESQRGVASASWRFRHRGRHRRV